MPHATQLTLPFPPTVNTYYRNVKGRTLMSKKGRAYRALAISTCFWQKTYCYAADVRLAVTLNLYPPNKRKWDIDNRVKATLDALQHAGIIPDDEQVDELEIIRCPISPDSRVEIFISEIFQLPSE
jgi:crossover junction endodeoxyribonuclease RusA